MLALGCRHEQPGRLKMLSPSCSVPAQVDGNADSEEEQESMGNVDIESGPITVDAQAVGLMVGSTGAALGSGRVPGIPG